MNPTLVVLAAGIGNRFGGLKQLTPIGPNQELLIDYSIYDARSAGFKKVVFVIRESIFSEFREKIGKQIEQVIETEYVFQEIFGDTLGFNINPNREKPWGTGQAVLVCRSFINDPFLVINADDYYGPEAYQRMIAHFEATLSEPEHYAMIGYKISETISKYGSVSRGVCEHDSDNNLVRVVERTQVEGDGDKIFYFEGDRKERLFADQLISMNIWGFKPGFFKFLEDQFTLFLEENHLKLKSEFYIPTAVNQLLQERKVKVKILPTRDQWFGITYKEDLEQAVIRMSDLVNKGKYPGKIYR